MQCAIGFAHFLACRYREALSWAEKAIRGRLDFSYIVVSLPPVQLSPGHQRMRKKQSSRCARLSGSLTGHAAECAISSKGCSKLFGEFRQRYTCQKQQGRSVRAKFSTSIIKNSNIFFRKKRSTDPQSHTGALRCLATSRAR